MSPYREWIQKQNDFLKRGCINPKTILYGRDAILRVRAKCLIFNMVLKLWADVKYHVPTGFGFSPKASGFYPFGDGIAKRLFFMFFVSVPQTKGAFLLMVCFFACWCHGGGAGQAGG